MFVSQQLTTVHLYLKIVFNLENTNLFDFIYLGDDKLKLSILHLKPRTPTKFRKNKYESIAKN